MNIQQAIKTISNKNNLTTLQTKDVMHAIMTGNATDAQIGGFLAALATKGEIIDEIIGGALVMRELSTKVNIKDKYLIDTCGTGGDDSSLFNISTASALVVATSGAKVAKHGNRSISSKSGSADVLELAGVNLNMSPQAIENSIHKIGIGFMFAQNHHLAMKYAIKVRRELAIRTIFNLLGPLTNPANTLKQVIGVYNKKLTTIFTKVLKTLGTQHAMVVHSADGLDEISIADKTFVSELKNNEIINYEITPEDFGIKRSNLNAIKVNNTKNSLNLIQQALDGKNGAAKDIIALNAGSAIYVSGKANNLKDGVDKAIEILNSGEAHQKLDDFIKLSTGC